MKKLLIDGVEYNRAVPSKPQTELKVIVPFREQQFSHHKNNNTTIV